jgi:CRISPR-associated protein Csm1
MPNASVISHAAALQVMQQAASALAHWAKADLPHFDSSSTAIASAIASAKNIVGWSDQPLDMLRLVFDSVHLNFKNSATANYRPAWALEIAEGETYPRIPYAQEAQPNDQDQDQLQQQIRAAIAALSWQNLTQLTLFVEKFGSHLSLGSPDVALIDLARSTGAIAAALAQQQPGDKLALIGGDLMGVQKFIYTISSEGALKSLRARSFYLELAAEEVVHKCDLCRSQQILSSSCGNR